jgi:hypothetical protein
MGLDRGLARGDGVRVTEPGRVGQLRQPAGENAVVRLRRFRREDPAVRSLRFTSLWLLLPPPAPKASCAK